MSIDYSFIEAIPEVKLLVETVKSLPPNPKIVEIGTYLGGSTVRMAEARPDAQITTVDCCGHGDNWNEPYGEYVQNYLVPVLGKITKEHLFNNLARFPNIQFIEGYSPMCVSDWNTELDLYFEDGDHSNPVLRTNLEFWGKFVKVGGLLAAHDYDITRCPDVVTEIDNLIGNGWEKVSQIESLIVLKKL